MKLNTTIRYKSIHIHVGSIWIRQNMNYPKFINFFLGYNVNTNRQALKIRKGGGWNKGTCTSTKVFFSVIFFATIFFDCWTMMNSYNWRFLDLTYLLMCDKILHFFFYTNVIVLTLLGIVFSIFVKFRWILYGTFWWTCLWRKFNWVRGWRKMVANTSIELIPE